MIRGKKLKAGGVAIALLIGLILGSLDQLSRFNTTDYSQEVVNTGIPDSTVERSVAPMQEEPDESDEPIPDVGDGPQHATAADDYPADTIFLPGEVTMAPFRENGIFVGYEILSAGTDDRLATGDVITSLNGMPVEDSAAGGELAMAALSSPDTKIETRRK